MRQIGFALVLAASLLAGCGSQGAASTRSGGTAGMAGHHRAAASPSAGAAGHQQYAGRQDRPIKALDPQRAEDLLAGRGLGYALAAELNHYPGPAHVLQLGDQLGLTPDQERATREVFAAMDGEARRLGRQLIDQERELDGLFASGRIGPEELDRLAGAIAAIEGQLREVHLAAHLQMKAILTPAQVARYDELRGYAAPGSAPAPHRP